MKKGRRAEERGTLRHVLPLRKLTLSPEEEQSINGCTDLAKLSRWHDEAILTTNAAEALRQVVPPSLAGASCFARLSAGSATHPGATQQLPCHRHHPGRNPRPAGSSTC